MNLLGALMLEAGVSDGECYAFDRRHQRAAKARGGGLFFAMIYAFARRSRALGRG